jgi:hypothetical protein
MKKSIEEEFKLKPIPKDRSVHAKRMYSLEKIIKNTKQFEKKVLRANDPIKA